MLGRSAALEPPEEHRPKHHVVTNTGAADNQCPRPMEQNSGAHSALAGLRTQASRKLRFNVTSRLDGLDIAGHIQKSERRSRLVHIRESPAEKLLSLALPRGIKCAEDVIPIWDGIGETQVAVFEAHRHLGE